MKLRNPDEFGIGADAKREASAYITEVFTEAKQIEPCIEPWATWYCTRDRATWDSMVDYHENEVRGYLPFGAELAVAKANAAYKCIYVDAVRGALRT